MLDEKNCPYLVIGMPSSESPTQAGRYFAAATKALRNTSSCPFGIEQMTAALAAIEKGTTGEYSFYTLPADPSAISSQSEVEIDGTCLQTSDQLATLFGTTVAPLQREEVAQTMLNHALKELLSWNFETSRRLCMEVLRLSRREKLRDEALNLSAATHYLLGEPNKALDALKHAVEGEWNLALQTNLSLIATDVDPGLAASQMRFIIEGAPSGQEKLNAAMKAVGLWRSTQEELTGSTEKENHEPMPEDLLDSIHRVLADPSISESDFYSLGMFLADHDSEKLRNAPSFAQSPWFNTASGQIVLARADGLSNYFLNIVRIAGEDGRDLPWIDESIEHLVAMVNSSLSADQNLFASTVGYSLINQGLKLNSLQRLIMCGLAVQGICNNMVETDNLPADMVFAIVRKARLELEAFSQQVEDSESIDFVRSIIDLSGEMVAALHHDFFMGKLRQIDQSVSIIKYETSGIFRRMGVNKSKLAEVCFAIRSACAEAESNLKEAQDLARGSELRIAIAELRHRFSTAAKSASY